MSGLPVSQRPGVVVLAAYRPDPELFAVQLRSIRDQTRTDFRCLVGADGGQEEVRRLVAESVGDDPRFEVLGWDDNRGFYLNFERLLEAVPEDVGWVALSDQDDRWYPDKLERLVPLLDGAALALGQARVVTWPGEAVTLERTHRHVVAGADLLFENQVTGALTVLHRDLLDIALPFPRLHTVTQLHDHWLALCATAVDRYVVLDEAVQDYVQHGGNLVGEVASHRQWTPPAVIRRVRELADTYEGGHSVAECLRACHVLGLGWRRLLLSTLAERVPGSDAVFGAAGRRLRDGAPLRDLATGLVAALRSPDVSPWVVATIVPGLPHEARLRRPFTVRGPRGARPSADRA